MHLVGPVRLCPSEKYEVSKLTLNDLDEPGSISSYSRASPVV